MVYQVHGAWSGFSTGLPVLSRLLLRWGFDKDDCMWVLVTTHGEVYVAYSKMLLKCVPWRGLNH